MQIRRYFTFRPFIDTLFCCLLMLVAILFLLKTKEEKTKARPPNVLFEVVLTWDAESEDDLDLYVQAASGHVVSFNNREGGEGSLISLDHDALGKRNHRIQQGRGVVSKFHEEVVAFRGITAGENIVNVHAYAKRGVVAVKCTIKLIKVKPYEEIITREKVFMTTGEEQTAFRFTTDEFGNVLKVNELPATLTNPFAE